MEDAVAEANLGAASNAAKKATFPESAHKAVVVAAAEVVVAIISVASTAAAAAICRGTVTNPGKAAAEVVEEIHEDVSTAEKVAICPGTAKSLEEVVVAAAEEAEVTPEAASTAERMGTCRETALNLAVEVVVAEEAAAVAAGMRKSPGKRPASKSLHLKLVVSLADKARQLRTYSTRAEPESRFIREMATNRMWTSSGLKKSATRLCS